METKYKRILLKLSGESLKGKRQNGIDFDLFKNKLDIYTGEKVLLHEFEEYNIDKIFIHVGYNFININTSDDYHSIIKTKKLIK